MGGGGHCKSCIDVIEQEGKYKIAGIVDAKESDTIYFGLSKNWANNDIMELFQRYSIITLVQTKNKYHST